MTYVTRHEKMRIMAYASSVAPDQPALCQSTVGTFLIGSVGSPETQHFFFWPYPDRFSPYHALHDVSFYYQAVSPVLCRTTRMLGHSTAPATASTHPVLPRLQCHGTCMSSRQLGYIETLHQSRYVSLPTHLIGRRTISGRPYKWVKST